MFMIKAGELTSLSETLLPRGIDPEEIDQSGMTALHYACELGRHENVEVLLQKAFKGMSNFIHYDRMHM